MALQMTTLQGTLRGPNGVALTGATLRFVLSHAAADLASNTALVRTPVDVVSDDEGAVSVDLWPNGNGFNNTYYDVRAYTTDENGIVSTYEFGQVQVPTVGPVDLADLLEEGVLRALDVEEQVLQGAIRAETAAQTAETSAATYNETALEERLNQRVDDWTSEAETDLKHFHEWTVAIDGDEDTFYPVVLAQDKTRFNDIEIVRSYNEDRGDAGVMSLHARFVGTGGSWGGNPCLLVPQFYTYRYQEAMARFGHVAHGRSAAFWLRGGGFQYCVRCTDPTADPQVYLTRTLILDHETDDHDWWVEPLTAVDPDMLPNDFGLTDAVDDAANQA